MSLTLMYISILLYIHVSYFTMNVTLHVSPSGNFTLRHAFARLEAVLNAHGISGISAMARL
jgi:hypothetical protein